jgi:hypothetical protein
MTIQIPLTRGLVTTVCDCHAHLAAGHKWSTAEIKGRYYATRGHSIVERLAGKSSHVFLHSVINNTPRGMETDHINGDTLDNRCENLRTATTAQNQRNRGKKNNNSSGFKGVSWDKRRQKWEAQFRADGEKHFVGYFETVEEAAIAYDEAVRKYDEKFSRTNFG